MKKILLIYCSFIVSIYLIFITENVFANGNNCIAGENYTDFNDYFVYFIGGYDLETFINNPSHKTLDNVCNSKYTYIRCIPNRKISILFESKENLMQSVETTKSLYVGLDGMFSEKNLRYLNKNNINKLLNDNGIINGEVNTVTLISISWNDGDGYPDVVWINTNKNENYYLVWDYPTIGALREIKEVEWDKADIISQEEFAKRYFWKNGTLYFCNNKVETELCPIFQSNTVRIPIRTVLESFGFEVGWDADNQVVFASKDNVEYAILLNSTKNMLRLNVEEYSSNVKQVQYFDPIFIKDNRIYVGGYGYLGRLMDALNIKGYDYDIDYLKQCVKIFS
ncbi:MAG: stalk domain-containing protein [Clostridia bacterium]|nr:stalk domain-containing protein [Clostridia bacterium]